MRTLTSPMVSLPAVAVLLAAAPGPARAQSVVAGAVIGVTQSRQLVQQESDSESRRGFVAGAWVDVETPEPLLHVLAEAAYARRGGRFPLGGPGGLTGEVESDWLAATVAPALHVSIGPVAAYAYGGPTLELHVRTRSAAALRNAYAIPSDQSFSVTAGGGLEGRMGSWSVRGEARIVEGLSSAYSGSAGDVRHRSMEVLLRVGKRRGGVQDPERPEGP
jgi:hypothetical protein